MMLRLFLDIVSIVFSILLALAVDRWRRHREDRRLAHEAARNLQAEIQRNLHDLRRVLSDLQQNRRNLREALDDLKKGPPQEGQGTQRDLRAEMPILVDAAWQVLLHTRGLNLLPLSLTSLLAEVYQAQRFLEGWLGRLSDLVASPLFFQKDRWQGNLQALLSLLANLESMATMQLEAYERALEALRSYLGAPKTEVAS